MAKKTTELDETIYVKQLTDAGMDNEKATTTIRELVELVNGLMEGESVEEKMNVISIKTLELVKEYKADKYRVVIVAASSRYDGNSGMRKNHLKKYQEDPDGAIQNGLVKLVKGEPVAIDNRRFLDKAETKENGGFGKPYKVRMQRDIIGISDGEIVTISGDINVIPGNTYEIFGKVSGSNNILYAVNDPLPRMLGTNGAGEFYEMVKTAAKESKNAMDVDGALNTEEKGTVIVKGYVHAATTMSNGKHKMMINNEMGSGFNAFPASDEADEAISKAVVGSEVIAIGRMRDSQDPQYGRSMNTFNVVMNPKSGSASKALEGLKGFRG